MLTPAGIVTDVTVPSNAPVDDVSNLPDDDVLARFTVVEPDVIGLLN